MSLVDTITNNLKKSLLDRDKDTVDLLRLLKAAFKNEMINLKKQELTDDEALKILKREAKKRHDSIDQFTKGNRTDLADKEKKELDMIKKYLPEAMSPDAVKKIVDQVISSMGQVAPSQFGAVMGAVMKKMNGQADGALVSQLVKQALNK